MLKSVFKIISFYDDVRWHSASNYNLINYYKTNLTEDTKLLTHWLCYIADRQMAFEKIWDVGGFIFSELVDTITKEKDLDLLNPNSSRAFIVKKGDGYTFTSISKSNGNDILKRYDIKDTEVATFSSRYYPSDYFSILYTLDFLKNYDFSIGKFICECYKQHQNREDYITRILFSLYLITYHEIGQPTKSDLVDFRKNVSKAEKHTKKVIAILNSVEKFEAEYHTFCKDKKFLQKRAWCSLRDFIKSPEFKEHFKISLKKHGLLDKDIERLLSLKSLQQFELPGDVWNNNSRFRQCILKGTEYENSKVGLNKILRKYFNDNQTEMDGYYPEQFDITFDFVPRMCDKNNCDICPIGYVKGIKTNIFKKTCVKNTELYCSVALADCNYKIDCFGKDCKLIEIVQPMR